MHHKAICMSLCVAMNMILAADIPKYTIAKNSKNSYNCRYYGRCKQFQITLKEEIYMTLSIIFSIAVIIGCIYTKKIIFKNLRRDFYNKNKLRG